jgi:signal transduction histidine kinase
MALPLITLDHAPDTRPANLTSPLETTVNILLVDDEARNLDVLESFLRTPDYNLVRALTADEALLLLLEGEFACIVLDIQMPEISGIELAGLIKNRRRTQHIPIIFLTAYFQEDKDVLQGYSTGAVDYLTKPINPQILKSKIEVFVDLFRKTRALEAEVGQRQEAEAALHAANEELEARVLARTNDLHQANLELRAREAALQVSEAQAKAASRAKDEFLAALSHELRTPLNPVLLVATEAAHDMSLPPEVRADFEMIAKNVSLEARLIDDMLDLTRIVHGKLTLERSPLDVHVGIRHAISLARAEIDRKQIELTVDLAAARSTVVGDEVRLEQAFWNIINNAAKFTPKSGRISIETSFGDDPGQIEIRITDTGIGMTPSELTRIFGAFAQGDHVYQAGNHRFGGLGLGLVISQAMIKRHNGTIEATSEGRNLGTSFVVTLPLLPADDPSGSPAGHRKNPKASADAGERRRLRRVLLVEDHGPTSDALTHLLSRRDYDVTAAPCLADARAAAKAGQFDILISDIGLPDGDACDLMTELGAHNGLIGIALSGYGMEADIMRTKAAGFISHLTKPVNVDALDKALALAQGNGGE